MSLSRRPPPSPARPRTVLGPPPQPRRLPAGSRLAPLPRPGDGPGADAVDFEHVTRNRLPSPTLLVRCNRAASELRVGDRLGDFLVAARLHEGRFATTYAARELTLGRLVALKLLDVDQQPNPLAHACLVHEAEIAARIGRPATAGVLRYAATRDGRAYLVTEHLGGEPLGRLLRRGRVTQRTALACLHQLFGVVATIHDRGVVHRNLSTRTVFIERLAARRRVRVLGFDLASGGRPERPGPELDSPHLFTEGYRAPELLRGGAIDHRVDLYALGVIAYQLLLHQHPHNGDDGPLRRLRPPSLCWRGIPTELDRLLRGLLADDPAARPSLAEARDLVTRATACLARRPRPPTVDPLLVDTSNEIPIWIDETIDDDTDSIEVDLGDQGAEAIATVADRC